MGVVAAFTPPQAPAVRPSSSSLLATTPAPVIRALSIAFPLLSAADRALGLLTWTTRDRFESVLVVATWILLFRYTDLVLLYFLPLVVVLGVYAIASQTRRVPPSLDTIIEVAERAGEKYQLLVSPVTSLELSSTEVIRLVFASLVLSPAYIAAAYFFVTPRGALYGGGLLVLLWHSLWFRVLRSVAWRFRIVRAMVFLATGVDRTPAARAAAASAGGAERAAAIADPGVSFTYVVYENQRRWLGIGWTANMVPEERAAWTDTSLVETDDIEVFRLPDADVPDMKWEWVTPEWQLDLSNGGMLGPEGPQRLKADPGDSEGFVYYSSVWTQPSATSGFSKYTRRRRWVRVAALVRTAPDKKAAAAPDAPNVRSRAPKTDDEFPEYPI